MSSNLSFLKLAVCDIRVIFSDNVGALHSVPTNECIPLFHGGDVLANSQIQPKNHSRLHARYAKESFAVKVYYRYCKHEAIASLSSAWFYTVTGLFKVAFEYLDIQFQHMCLSELTNVWLAHMNSSIIVPEGTDLSLDIPQKPSELMLHHSAFTIVDNTNSSPPLPSDGIVRAFDETPSLSEITESAGYDEQHGTTATLYHPNTVNSSGTSQCNDSSLHFQGVIEVMRDISNFIRGKLNFSDASAKTVNVLLKFVDIVKEDFQNDHQEDGFPYELLDNYIAVCRDNNLHTKMDDHCGLVSQYRSTVLCVISQWLGTQFHNMSHSITHKVEQFKKENLQNIDSLPPPKELVTNLFPVPMVMLLQAWMKEREYEAGNEHSDDHTYSPPHKRCCLVESGSTGTHGDDIYPVMQVILEFANSALVSGVAHVVYSRLAHL